MPTIEGKSHGVFYGHGTVTTQGKSVPIGKALVLYGPPRTTLADEIAKYVVLYLQNPTAVAPIVRGDLAQISGLQMKIVQEAHPRRRLDDLSSELWNAATPLMDYPKRIDAGQLYQDVRIGSLESVSIYRLRPRFVTEFDHQTRLSDALGGTEHDVIHLTTCQARSINDDLVILHPDKSTFAYRTNVAVEIEEERHEQSLEELYAQKVGLTSTVWNPFVSNRNVFEPPTIPPSSNPFESIPFSGVTPRLPSPSEIRSSFGSTPWSPSPPEIRPSPTPSGPMLACHKCSAFEPWHEQTQCPSCGRSNYEVRYVCLNPRCIVFERGQSEYKKTSRACQYCDAPL